MNYITKDPEVKKTFTKPFWLPKTFFFSHEDGTSFEFPEIEYVKLGLKENCKFWVLKPRRHPPIKNPAVNTQVPE